jgi:hypothetical protein
MRHCFALLCLLLVVAQGEQNAAAASPAALECGVVGSLVTMSNGYVRVIMDASQGRITSIQGSFDVHFCNTLVKLL